MAEKERERVRTQMSPLGLIEFSFDQSAHTHINKQLHHRRTIIALAIYHFIRFVCVCGNYLVLLRLSIILLLIAFHVNVHRDYNQQLVNALNENKQNTN